MKACAARAGGETSTTGGRKAIRWILRTSVVTPKHSVVGPWRTNGATGPRMNMGTSSSMVRARGL